MTDNDFMAVAHVFGARSTCGRAKVGAVIVRDRRIISTGYNGAPSGMEHCHHTADIAHCTRAVHAEVNAIAFAAKNGTATDEATIYCTMMPCSSCAKLIVQAGIHCVVYQYEYTDREGHGWLVRAGLEIRRLK